MKIESVYGQKNTYRKIKEYKYYVLFENIKTGAKECFFENGFKEFILDNSEELNG